MPSAEDHPTTRTTPTLKTLPLEILALAISFLDQDPSTLATLCRVSSQFLEIAGSVLYREIYISPTGKNSLFDAQQIADHEDPSPHADTRKARLLRNAKIVHIDTHPPNWCKNQIGFHPQKINILDLSCPFSEIMVSTPHICQLADDEDNEDDEGSKSCIVTRYQPKKVILRNVHFLRTSEALRRLSTHASLGPTELTIICTNMGPAPISFYTQAPHDILRNVKTLCVIVPVEDVGTPWQSMFTAHNAREDCIGLRNVAAIIRRLPIDASIYLVTAGPSKRSASSDRGSGAPPPSPDVPTQLERSMEMLSSHLRLYGASLIAGAPGKNTAEDRMKNIHFIGEEEALRRFDYEET
ncbi:uncharacterized protein I303_101852 [Kwoniella dejecticola CBS 10117]|uniref:F-box domain-containing protein n=1 Tax=Kwoniella dejecticola CBS 10117 TaxID=1296121 RepID=A0A1A6ACL3_9TREE|nr:uncharacterized protein I303_02012 [Kwoniella dejecticola CBS 10117]OBR87799.1 hypothetical protein I303_02012 [Kwoniella dejecticola CBS 10117]